MREVRDQMITTIESLSKPAPRAWIQGEVAKTLVHYFVGVIPENFAKSIGADYDHELAEFPAWAIVKARRWWLSNENEYRHRKPMPGDLSARCRVEVAVLRIASQRIERFDLTGSPLFSFEKADDAKPIELTEGERDRRADEMQKLLNRFGEGARK